MSLPPNPHESEQQLKKAPTDGGYQTAATEKSRDEALKTLSRNNTIQRATTEGLYRDAQNLTNKLFPNAGDLLGSGTAEARQKRVTDLTGSDGETLGTRRQTNQFSRQNTTDTRPTNDADRVNIPSINDKKFA